MKICKTCNHCKPLYMRHAWSYNKTRLYYCARRDELLTRFIFCEKWQGKICEYNLSSERLEGVQQDIKTIMRLSK